jgi:hypothetical protein
MRFRAIMHPEGSSVMRLFAALLVGVILYIALPMLWQHAMVAKVNEISANQDSFPVASAPIVTNVDTENIANALKPQYVDINTEEYQRIGTQSAADDAMRHIQAAQDQAWAASH